MASGRYIKKKAVMIDRAIVGFFRRRLWWTWWTLPEVVDDRHPTSRNLFVSICFGGIKGQREKTFFWRSFVQKLWCLVSIWNKRSGSCLGYSHGVPFSFSPWRLLFVWTRTGNAARKTMLDHIKFLIEKYRFYKHACYKGYLFTENTQVSLSWLYNPNFSSIE